MGTAPHPEDIKAMIRKRYKSIAAFERSQDLPARSVKDVLRGRSRPRIAVAIAEAINEPIHKLFPKRFPSPIGDTSIEVRPDAQHLNAEAE